MPQLIDFSADLGHLRSKLLQVGIEPDVLRSPRRFHFQLKRFEFGVKFVQLSLTSLKVRCVKIHPFPPPGSCRLLRGLNDASAVPHGATAKPSGLKTSLNKGLLAEACRPGSCIDLRGTVMRSSDVRADRPEAMQAQARQQRCSSGGAVAIFSLPRRIARSLERSVTRDRPNRSAALVRFPPA